MLPEVRVESIITRAELMGAKVVVVDSIQTTYSDELEGAPGNVGQVRECAAKLMRFAKFSGAAVFLVGHVTRGGVIAGALISAVGAGTLVLLTLVEWAGKRRRERL